MSIVFFVTLINLGLAVGLLWVARHLWQWRRSLTHLNRRLQASHQTLQQQFQQAFSGDAPLVAPDVVTEYQQFAAYLFPRLQFSAKTFAGLHRAHRLWRVTMKKRRGF
jgi:hypothetical protein